MGRITEESPEALQAIHPETHFWPHALALGHPDFRSALLGAHCPRVVLALAGLINAEGRPRHRAIRFGSGDLSCRPNLTHRQGDHHRNERKKP